MEQGGRAESRDKVRLEHFVPMETYDSMQRCYYGFVSMIKLWGRAAALLVLNQMNQDCCEFHCFSHIHAACRNASQASDAIKCQCLCLDISPQEAGQSKHQLMVM
jgi:hypothetical protein